MLYIWEQVHDAGAHEHTTSWTGHKTEPGLVPNKQINKGMNQRKRMGNNMKYEREADMFISVCTFNLK